MKIYSSYVLDKFCQLLVFETVFRREKSEEKKNMELNKTSLTYFDAVLFFSPSQMHLQGLHKQL